MELGVIEVLSCLAVNGTLTFFFSAIVSSYFANELASFIADFTFNEYKHNVSLAWASEAVTSPALWNLELAEVSNDTIWFD